MILVVLILIDYMKLSALIIRNSTLSQAASQKGFFCRLEKSMLVLREQHYYYYQVQGQVAICSRKWCDSEVFTNAGISILQIFFDEIFWATKASKLKCFHSTALVLKLANILCLFSLIYS